MTHTITVTMQDKVPDEIQGLPKNWKIIFRDYSWKHEGNRMAHCDGDEKEYYLEYSLRSIYSGEVIGLRLTVHQINQLKKMLELSVRKFGHNQYKGLLETVEKCVGY